MPAKKQKKVDNSMTEQQQHLQSLLQQRQTLQQEIDSARSVVESKRELILKVQGAIEYLTQIGVTLPEVEPQETESSEEG